MTGSSTRIEDIILTVLAILIIIIFAGSIYSLFRAIFEFIFSNGDNDKIKKARNNIRYTIIGIIITLLLLFAFPLLFKQMRVSGYQYYSAQNIFNRASLIIRKILGGGADGTADIFTPTSDYTDTYIDSQG